MIQTENSEMARRAAAFHAAGHNCAQAVALPFCEKLGMDEETMAKMLSSFGGGVGGLRELCGALAGASLVCGLYNGNSDPGDMQARLTHRARIQSLGLAFQAEMGGLQCRELVPDPTIPKEQKPCRRAVEVAAALAERYLATE